MQVTPLTPAQSWDATLYHTCHSFVWQEGESLLELLQPEAAERILDLGCGTGQLTQKIAATGAEVIGLDADRSMLEQAKQHYAKLTWIQADARNFQLDRPVNAVFSNAALHWIPDADAVIGCISQALQPGGRFVAEFGGQGNVQAIVQALYTVLQDMGCDRPEVRNPWYFPSISDYATRLERQGFEVTYAVLFDRPTALAGEAGLANWLCMFAADRFFTGFSTAQITQAIEAIERHLRPTLYQAGVWYADYRRLRVMAVKR